MTSIEWPSARVTIAFLTSDCWPNVPRKRFTLPLRTRVLTLFDLDVEELLHGRLDLRLGGVLADLEDDLVLLGQGRRLLGDDRAEDDVVVTRIGAHLKRASSASTAALVSTSFSRRRMS